MRTRHVANENGLLVEDEPPIAGRAALQSLGLDLDVIPDGRVHPHQNDAQCASVACRGVTGADDSPDGLGSGCAVQLQSAVRGVVNSHQ